jgi:hypothetical protein
LSGSEVYAGGAFTTAGGLPANFIAKWNGMSWSALGTGMNNSVYALAVDGSGNVYAGGYFGILKWNGTSWSALGPGMNGSISALALDGSGNLYAGGWFGQPHCPVERHELERPGNGIEQ